MEFIMKEVSKTTRITPEGIIKIFQIEDITLSEAEATQLLMFLKKIARITVTKYLEGNEC